VAHALVQVEQGELGTRVGPLTADDDPGALGQPCQVDQSGQLGDLGAFAQGAVLFEGGMPDLLGQVAYRAADRFGDGPSDGEAGERPA
jgi:hypothetical protein